MNVAKPTVHPDNYRSNGLDDPVLVVAAWRVDGLDTLGSHDTVVTCLEMTSGEERQDETSDEVMIRELETVTL